MKRLSVVLVLLAVVTAGGISAQEPESKGTKQITLPAVATGLKAGEGKDKAEILCNICHSLDYITMQPKGSRAQWTATVNKMIKVFGAPIPEHDASVIIEYLGANYGTGK